MTIDYTASAPRTKQFEEKRTLFKRPGLILAGLALLMLIPIGSVIVLSPRPAPLASLVATGGEITIVSGTGVDAQSRVIAAGDVVVVEPGDTIIVGDNSQAQITWYDGATSTLAAGTQLELSGFESEHDNYRVRLSLSIGKITTQIQRLLKPSEAFEIITPSSAVTVRGTTFTVEVWPDQSAEISVDSGVVHVQTASEEVDVNPGEAIRVEGERLMPPAEAAPADVAPVEAGRPAAEEAATTGEEAVAPPDPTPTAPPPPPTRAPVVQAPAPTTAPLASNANVTTTVEPVWYCTQRSDGSYQWYEVEMVYENGVKVKENVLSGPYTGGWQPNCPADPGLPVVDDDLLGGGSSGGVTSGVDCLVNPDHPDC